MVSFHLRGVIIKKKDIIPFLRGVIPKFHLVISHNSWEDQKYRESMDRLDDLSLIVPYLGWKFFMTPADGKSPIFFYPRIFLSLNFNMHLPEHGSANRLTRDLNSVSFQVGAPWEAGKKPRDVGK